MIESNQKVKSGADLDLEVFVPGNQTGTSGTVF